MNALAPARTGRWIIPAVLTLFVFPLPRASALDTGHHFDLTASVLRDFGFSRAGIQITQCENWYTDFVSQVFGGFTDTSVLHFDNLHGTEAVSSYWNHLVLNTHDAIQDAVRRNDALSFFTAMGVSLHTVQDFYSHSNWVEKHPGVAGGPYLTQTWFNSPAPTGMRTGDWPNHSPIASTDHGDYVRGMNKDSYYRPKWDAAYVFGYCGSREWVNAIHSWADEVDPGFWDRARGYSLSFVEQKILNRDLRWGYRLSEWVGHWKGPGSGSPLEFANLVLEIVRSVPSPYLVRFMTWGEYRKIADHLMDTTTISSIPTVPTMTLTDRRAVIVRTTTVQELPVSWWELKIDPLGWPDFYAAITIDEQQFIEAMQIDKSYVKPQWTAIAFAPVGNAYSRIHYELWDEDLTAATDDLCDINSRSPKKMLDFRFWPATHNCTEDISGRYDVTPVYKAGAKPDNNRAGVQLIITERRLQ